jgi:hypothetical protein
MEAEKGLTAGKACGPEGIPSAGQGCSVKRECSDEEEGRRPEAEKAMVGAHCMGPGGSLVGSASFTGAHWGRGFSQASRRP